MKTNVNDAGETPHVNTICKTLSRSTKASFTGKRWYMYIDDIDRWHVTTGLGYSLTIYFTENRSDLINIIFIVIIVTGINNH